MAHAVDSAGYLSVSECPLQ